MSKNLDEYERVKARLAELKTEADRDSGKHEQILGDLKKAGYATEKAARKAVSGLEAETQRLDVELAEELNAVKAEFPELAGRGRRV